MHDFRDEAGPWADSAGSPDQDRLETGPRATDAIPGPVPRKINIVSARSALLAGLLRFGPHAALTAWVIAVAWMAGSHFDGPVRTVVQQQRAEGVEPGQAAQKAAEDLRVQKPQVEAMRAAETLSTKEAVDPGNAKPHLDAVKPEISGGIPEASGKVEHLRPKSGEAPSKAGKQLDRIGLEIATLMAAAPAADRSAHAPGAERRARTTRHDAFDPSLNPTAPGAPRPLGTAAPATTAGASAAENGYGQRAN
jgi:hypothetical protein